jgi:hypothetical protein
MTVGQKGTDPALGTIASDGRVGSARVHACVLSVCFLFVCGVCVCIAALHSLILQHPFTLLMSTCIRASAAYRSLAPPRRNKTKHCLTTYQQNNNNKQQLVPPPSKLMTTAPKGAYDDGTARALAGAKASTAAKALSGGPELLYTPPPHLAPYLSLSKSARPPRGVNVLPNDPRLEKFFDDEGNLDFTQGDGIPDPDKPDDKDARYFIGGEHKMVPDEFWNIMTEYEEAFEAQKVARKANRKAHMVPAPVPDTIIVGPDNEEVEIPDDWYVRVSKC